MKINRFRLVTTLIIGLMLVAGVAILAPGMNTVIADSKSMVGSWDVQITVNAQNAIFPGLVTFTNDGIIMTDEVPSPLETSGHGAWVKTKANEAAYTFVFLIGSSDPNGQWLKGTVSGKAVYEPKKDRWGGPFTIKLVSQDGAEILSDTGRMDGIRITAFP